MNRLEPDLNKTNDQFIYQQKMFKSVALLIELFIISMLVTCHFEFHNTIYSAVLVAFLIIIGAVYVLAEKKREYRKFTTAMFILANFFMVPVFFTICGGLIGGMPMACLAGLMTFVIFSNRRERLIAAAVTMVSYVALFVLVGLPGTYVSPMPEEMVKTDIIVTYILVGFLCIALIITVLDIYNRSVQDKFIALERHYSVQTELLQSQMESSDYIKRMRHDMRHHNAVIAEFARKGDMEGLLSYLDSRNEEDEKYSAKIYCMNAVVNNIITVYCRNAGRKGVEMLVSAEVPADVSVEETDLTAILANLLENAINAAEASGEEKKEVDLRISVMKHKLIIQCTNTSKEDIVIENGIPSGQSTGIESVMDAVKKNNGEIRYSIADRKVSATVLIDLG